MKISSAMLALTLFFALLPQPAVAQEKGDVMQGLDTVAELLQVIRDNYYQELEGGELVDSAISGMLGQLDPHSSYISPEQARQLQSQQQGEYYGVGMTVGMRDGRMYCVSPHAGGPAEAAGLRAGDVIISIAGKETSEHEYTDNVERLRGPRGTTVTITVERPGYEEPMTFEVTRDRISLKSVPYAFMLDETTGYIRINSFSHATDKEVREEILALQRHGLEKLLLDLRSNPVGDLDSSVGVANLFIDEGQLVYTKGISGQIMLDYYADEESTIFRGPLVVLINTNSASGSEVVAGALQDHDRAWVVGEKSWGKGLVQTQYPLEYGALLSLTTAKYYTPSGRLIQKPYEPGNFDQYYNPEETDSPVDEENLDAASTDLGRIVYGGNGIMPDQIIPSTAASTNVQEIIGRGLIFSFVNEMMTEDPTIEADYYAEAEDMQKFRDFLNKNGVEYDDISWQRDYSFLAARVTLETHNRSLGAEHGFQMVFHTDKQLQEALAAFDKARELLARRIRELDGSTSAKK